MWKCTLCTNRAGYIHEVTGSIGIIDIIHGMTVIPCIYPALFVLYLCAKQHLHDSYTACAWEHNTWSTQPIEQLA